MTFRKDFKRYELKYLMDAEQTETMFNALKENMYLDKYGHSSIRNIYLDTDNFILARRSIEKPLYKEKLRFRTYGPTGPDDSVFVELKKKYDGVVYKRRLSMPLNKAMEWFTSDSNDYPNSQIGEEINFLRTRYEGIKPMMFLSYDRDAYHSKDGSDLRITVDSNIMARTYDLDLTMDVGGFDVMPEGYALMEIKTMNGYPPWLMEVLSENSLYKTSFSKYGNAYKEIILGMDPMDLCAQSVISCDLESSIEDDVRYGTDKTVYSHSKLAAVTNRVVE